MIFLGVVYVILALFVVSSNIGYKASVVNEMQGVSESGDAISNTDEVPPLSLYDKTVLDSIMGTVMNVPNVGDNFKYMFQYFGDYVSALGDFSKVYFVLFIVLVIFYKPGNEYEKIEHGSADWAHGGEEYRVLSKSEGFILAKDHYMPMIPNPPSGKNGNILVIRRFWFR